MLSGVVAFYPPGPGEDIKDLTGENVTHEGKCADTVIEEQRQRATGIACVSR